MNITKSTFWFTLAQGILGVLASSLQERNPEVSFWCGILVACVGVILLNIKQFSQPKQDKEP